MDYVLGSLSIPGVAIEVAVVLLLYHYDGACANLLYIFLKFYFELQEAIAKLNCWVSISLLHSSADATQMHIHSLLFDD